MQKKAQFWYSDFLLAILILVGINFLFIRNITDLNSRQDKLQSIAGDSISISNLFLSEGYCPTNNCLNDWSNLNGRIGFVKEGKVIQSNLNDLITLTSTSAGYESSKILLGIRNNYIFYFEDSDGTKISISMDSTFGKTQVSEGGIADINSESLVKTTRFVYLDHGGLKKIVKLAIIAW